MEHEKTGLVRSLTVGPIQTNCYFLTNPETKETVIVDPGDEPDRLRRFLTENEWKPAAVLLTHGHYDHVLGVNDLKSAYPGIPVVISEKEKPMVLDQGLNSGIGGYDYTYEPTRYVEDLDVLKYAGFSFQVISTPGHTAGSCCYYEKDQKILFSGDTIFRHSYGRYDFPTGSFADLRKSLMRVLTSLPDEVRVLPGHGEETSIGEEKAMYGIR